MHLMVPYRHGIDDGAEFRYALRSIQTNLHPVDGSEVFLSLVGDRPTWCDPDLYVEWDNHFEWPTMNSAYGMWLLAKRLYDEGVREAFHLDDDYFCMFPQGSILPVNAGSLKAQVRSILRCHTPTHPYVALAENSLLLLGDVTSFERHLPLPLVLRQFLISQTKAIEVSAPGIFWRTLYGSRHLTRSFYGEDGRHPSSPGVPWLSTNDRDWSASALGRRLSTLFSKPSRWEK